MDAKRASSQPDQLDHQRLTTLINSMADAVIAVDERLKVVLYNAAALNILDVNTIKEGAPLVKLFKPVDKNNQPVDVEATVHQAARPTANRDWRLHYKEGSYVSLYTSIAPVRLGYGQAGQGGHVILLRDITREKSLEEERDEFISVVSHELRTPIAIAEGNIGNVEFMVTKGSDTQTIKQGLKEAHNQVLFLADMINDLSTLSRAERGKLELEVESINVHDLVKQLGENYSAEADKKGLKLQTEIDPKLELLNSSQLYVREILQNFITNAIKYTDKGHITIRANSNPKGVRFDVIDTGIGISKADQEKVFDKFFRSEDFRTRQASGTGLGLYVTFKLVQLLHAEVSVKSEPGKGSTFTLFVPNLK